MRLIVLLACLLFSKAICTKVETSLFGAGQVWEVVWANGTRASYTIPAKYLNGDNGFIFTDYIKINENEYWINQYSHLNMKDVELLYFHDGKSESGNEKDCYVFLRNSLDFAFWQTGVQVFYGNVALGWQDFLVSGDPKDIAEGGTGICKIRRVK